MLNPFDNFSGRRIRIVFVAIFLCKPTRDCSTTINTEIICVCTNRYKSGLHHTRVVKVIKLAVNLCQTFGNPSSCLIRIILATIFLGEPPFHHSTTVDTEIICICANRCKPGLHHAGSVKIVSLTVNRRQAFCNLTGGRVSVIFIAVFLGKPTFNSLSAIDAEIVGIGSNGDKPSLHYTGIVEIIRLPFNLHQALGFLTIFQKIIGISINHLPAMHHRQLIAHFAVGFFIGNRFFAILRHFTAIRFIGKLCRLEQKIVFFRVLLQQTTGRTNQHKLLRNIQEDILSQDFRIRLKLRFFQLVARRKRLITNFCQRCRKFNFLQILATVKCFFTNLFQSIRKNQFFDRFVFCQKMIRNLYHTFGYNQFCCRTIVSNQNAVFNHEFRQTLNRNFTNRSQSIGCHRNSCFPRCLRRNQTCRIYCGKFRCTALPNCFRNHFAIRIISTAQLKSVSHCQREFLFIQLDLCSCRSALGRIRRGLRNRRV